MTLYKVRNLKSGLITNQWVSSSVGADHYEPSFGKPGEYEVIAEDITAQVAQEQANNEALAYLASTDWYVLRCAETGKSIPDDVRLARADARARIVKGEGV